MTDKELADSLAGGLCTDRGDEPDCGLGCRCIIDCEVIFRLRMDKRTQETRLVIADEIEEHGKNQPLSAMWRWNDVARWLREDAVTQRISR